MQTVGKGLGPLQNTLLAGFEMLWFKFGIKIFGEVKFPFTLRRE
jgi:hypothetical protein